MVKVGFICEGFTETILIASDNFNSYLQSINIERMNVINAEGSGFMGAGQTANVNPGYVAGSKPNPFWNTYNFNTACIYPNNFNRANNFSLNLMKNTNDARFRYFYLPVRIIINSIRRVNINHLNLASHTFSF